MRFVLMSPRRSFHGDGRLHGSGTDGFAYDGDHAIRIGRFSSGAHTGRGARNRGSFSLDFRHHRCEPANACRGNITLLTNLCERTRAEAFDLMLAHAAELGGNAVVGARYDATEIMQGVTEVLAYGTAVQVEPVNRS